MTVRLIKPIIHTLACGAVALALSLDGPEAHAEVKLRLTHSAPVSHPNHIAAEKMVQRIK